MVNMPRTVGLALACLAAGLIVDKPARAQRTGPPPRAPRIQTNVASGQANVKTERTRETGRTTVGVVVPEARASASAWEADDPASKSSAKSARDFEVTPASRLSQIEGGVKIRLPDPPPSILLPDMRPIDLSTALRLAGVQNPELNVARARVTEAVALRQLAAAKFLPSINLGLNYDNHTGVLQQSNGNILTVNRAAFYIGAGSNAVAAGSVNIPGVVLSGNVAVAVYGNLVAMQLVRARQFENLAVRNQVFLQVALAYSELVRAEGQVAIARQARDEARTVAELTAQFLKVGEGAEADANRAKTELARRESNVQAAEGQLLTSSADLCRLLNLDPSVRLHATDATIVPMPIVPDPVPIQQLIGMALLRRPELGAQRALIAQAFLSLEGAQVLPFSPNVLVGFSAGGFGGGSNLVRPVFGGFGGRSDFDAVIYWTLQNMGVGNIALIRAADARLQMARFEQIGVLNRVRSEVAQAYAKTHARFAQIGTNEEGVRAGQRAFAEDYQRTVGGGVRLKTVLPIELLNSFRLMAEARFDYLNSIVDYNRAQFELYVAMGQPPAAALARPVPTEGIVDQGGVMSPVGPQAPGSLPATIPAGSGRAGDNAPAPPPANNADVNSGR